MSVFDDQGNITPWFEATWKERCWLLVVYVGIAVGSLAGFFAILVVFGIILVVFGMMIEGIGRHHVEHERCLKNATNGYEILTCRWR